MGGLHRPHGAGAISHARVRMRGRLRVPRRAGKWGRWGALGRWQSRGQHTQHGRGALLWVYRGREPPHTTGRTAQVGLNWAAPARVALVRACAGHHTASCASECTPPTPVVHVPNGHALVASPV